MNALTLVIAAVAIFTIAYRFYALFIARRVLGIRPERPVPAVTLADGRDYVKTNRYIIFGHHFAAIAAAGPLLGPVLAAQYGYMPGALWIIFGSVFAGAVHDMVVLFASVRHRGESISRIAEKELGRVTGFAASIAVLAILILTLAGLALTVVNSMAASPWATFTVFSSIPIAFLMGVWLHKLRPGDVIGASVIGVSLLFLAIWYGPHAAANPLLRPLLTLSKNQIAIFLPAYGFVASVLPVWVILCPRDYLSTYLKAGTIAMLAVAVVILRPVIQMPALSLYAAGQGPVIAGPLFPFLFITIACGAISGFHAIIASGTTPKMVASERDIPFVGYGGMLLEGMVAIMALIAACCLQPADYFAINATPENFAKLNVATVELPELEEDVGEKLQGRTGGGVSLAVGMAYIFSSLPHMADLMAYWYHFVIMFEALFVLTAVDTGTRIGRFLLQELAGRAAPRFADGRWLPGVWLTSAVFCLSWGYLLYTGNITTIWPLFGMCNQLLAGCALIVVAVMMVRRRRGWGVWLLGLPGLFTAVVTFIAGYETVRFNYLPKGLYLLSALALIVMALMLFIFSGAALRLRRLLAITTTVRDEEGEDVREAAAQ